MNLNIYENQITGLLGHNGAGKSTTIFMLSGIIAPTSGTAEILGFDLRFQMDRIRSQMGFCPQNDIHYDLLTVYEHLKLIIMFFLIFIMGIIVLFYSLILNLFI